MPDAQASSASTPTELGASFAEIGRFGGRATAIVVGDGRAYVGMGQQVAVFDVAQAGQWTLLGVSGTLPGVVRTLVLAGRTVYAGIGFPPILVSVDVSNPARPRVLASLSLMDFDVGFFDGFLVNDMAFAGDYLYVALIGGGLSIVDIRDPARPLLLRHLPVDAVSIDVAGGHAYAARFGRFVEVWSLANPLDPLPVSLFFLSQGEDIADMALAGTRVYLLGAQSEGSQAVLEVFDVSDPVAPLLMLRQTVDMGNWDALRIAAEGDLVCLFALQDSFSRLFQPLIVRALDMTNPAAPVESGRFELRGDALDAVAVGNGLAYLAAGEDGLAAVDLRRPAAPESAGRFTLPRPRLGYAARGGWVYTATRDGLMVLDARDPTQPRPIGIYAPASGDEVSSLALAGDRVYLTYRAGDRPGAAGRPGLALIDVSQPALPRELGFFETPVDATAVVVVGDLAYLVAGPGLRLVDVADPGRPREIGAFRSTSTPRHLAVQGTRAFLALSDSREALELVDVRDPTTPRRLSLTRFESTIEGLIVRDQLAYVLLWGRGLSIFDINDLTQPVVEDELELQLFGRQRLSLVGPYAYVSQFETEFNSFLRQVMVRGRVRTFAIDTKAGQLRATWQSQAFGDPVMEGGIGYAEGPNGELVVLEPLGPPRVFLPVALDGVEWGMTQ